MKKIKNECGQCGSVINDEIESEQNRHPCKKCGSLTRNINVSINESLILRDGIGVKAKHTGDKKPFIESKDIPDYNRDRGKIVNLKRIIDRENDIYHEIITDYETGEIIYEKKEKLSEHTGHGYAKK